MKKIITIIGARPQIIKAAAFSRAIKNSFSDKIQEVLVHTGQHYDANMSDIFFGELGIPKPDYLLQLGGGGHGEQTGKMLIEIEKILIDEKPDALLVYGDTNSTIAGGLAAVKMHIPVIHVEAGLRSFNKKMPEEINRIATDHFSTLLFSPTAAGAKNLVKEGFNVGENDNPSLNNPKAVHCGDVMYDNSLHFSSIADEKSTVLKDLDLPLESFILSTIHRPSNTDDADNLKSILEGLVEIAARSNKVVILPIHPRTKGRVAELLAASPIAEFEEKVRIVDPVSFLDMIMLEKSSYMVCTDSGGVQKEAYFFGKNCIILREETEWVEIVEAGAAITVGPSKAKMIDAYEKLSKADNSFPELFGDGKASEFICEEILKVV